MRKLVLAFVACAAMFGQANPIQRVKTYAGTPTAGDCTAALVGLIVGVNTTPNPDALYDCLDQGGSPTWIARATGSGTVSSVDLSAPSVFSVSGNPITTSGTLALAFAAGQTQNRVLASPNGSTGAVSLRALVGADIPDLSATYQPLDADLTAIGGLSPSRGGMIRRGVSAWENVALGAAGAVMSSDGTDAVWLARVSATGTIDFASIPDGACLESTFALTGASLGDPVALGTTTANPTGVQITAEVSAINTARVKACNWSGAAVDMSSRDFTVRVTR